MDIVILGEGENMAGAREVMSLPPGFDRLKPPSSETPQLQITASTPEAEGSVPTLGESGRESGRDSPDRGIVPVATSEAPVLISGNLQKLGKVFKRWHQRYFEIQGQHMYYYKNSTKQHCLGEIDLNICFSAGASNAATFGYAFELQTTQRVHVLAAKTYDEMHRWIEVIQTNMGASESKRRKKVKRWESIKSTFSQLQPHRHAHSSQDPSATLGVQGRRRAKPSRKVDRNQSFMQRLKHFRRRERGLSPSSSHHSEDELSPVHTTRPVSMMTPTKLEPVVEPPPTPRSLPNTPLTKKRDVLEPSPPQSPLSFEYTASPSEESHSIPSHTSTPARGLSPGVETSETGPKEPVKLAPTGAEPAIPEFLSKRYVWDDIREFLESLPEKREDYSYEELPPEENSWEDRPTGMEQLRQFLAVCA